MEQIVKKVGKPRGKSFLDIAGATGGGAILREENRQLLKENGFIVYLQCSVDRILERTRRDSQRPLLNTENIAFQ